MTTPPIPEPSFIPASDIIRKEPFVKERASSDEIFASSTRNNASRCRTASTTGGTASSVSPSTSSSPATDRVPGYSRNGFAQAYPHISPPTIFKLANQVGSSSSSSSSSSSPLTPPGLQATNITRPAQPPGTAPLQPARAVEKQTSPTIAEAQKRLALAKSQLSMGRSDTNSADRSIGHIHVSSELEIQRETAATSASGSRGGLIQA
jgi:hypothetical protein